MGMSFRLQSPFRRHLPVQFGSARSRQQMSDAAHICSRLIVAGTPPPNSLPELDHPLVRAEVEKTLADCGLSLASSAYSEYWGIQLSTETADATVLDTATNLGLGVDACAHSTVSRAHASTPSPRLVAVSSTVASAVSVESCIPQYSLYALLASDSPQSASVFSTSARTSGWSSSGKLLGGGVPATMRREQMCAASLICCRLLAEPNCTGRCLRKGLCSRNDIPILDP